MGVGSDDYSTGTRHPYAMSGSICSGVKVNTTHVTETQMRGNKQSNKIIKHRKNRKTTMRNVWAQEIKPEQSPQPFDMSFGYNYRKGKMDSHVDTVSRDCIKEYTLSMDT